MKDLSKIGTVLFSSLLSIILLFLFHKYLSRNKSKNLPSNLNEEKLLEAHQGEYKIEEIYDLRNEFKTPLTFTDIQFEEKYKKGNYVNKNPNGSRKTFGDELCDQIPQNRKIWMFGGSTMYGYGLPDKSTIPSHLSRLLNKKTSKDWCIQNFGRGYYYSDQELTLLVNLIAKTNLKGELALPKYVIFLDGLNDHFHLNSSSFVYDSSENNGIYYYFLASSIKVFNRIEQIITGNNPGRNLVKFKNTTTKNCSPIQDLFKFNKLSKECKKDIKNSTKKMISNWITAQRIAKSYKINFIPILQPVPGYKQNKINFGPKTNVGKQHKFAGYAYKIMDKEAYKIMPNQINSKYLDISSIFSEEIDSCNYPYIDPIHYSNCGSELISNLISKHLIDINSRD